MNKLRSVTVALLLTLSAVSSSYAIFGIGAHWGFDYSLSMDDAVNESVFSAGGTDFASVSRTDWRMPSVINFGGKAFIDIIPVIDAIEVSCNFGLWQYEGVLHYPTAITAPTTLDGSLDLGLKGVGLDYLGLDNTPYAKLHLDASVRKTVFKLPADIFKFSAGAGASVHFVTPLLTSGLIRDVLGEVTYGELIDMFNDPVYANKYGRDIVQEILDKAMSEPVFGMHVVAGVSVKIPLIPVGVYADGKYMIPLGKIDEGKRINGFGVLLNAGLMFAI